MNTTFKLQLSLIGAKVKQAFISSCPIDIRANSLSSADLRPFSSLPANPKGYSPGSDNGDDALSDSSSLGSNLPVFSLKEVLMHDTPDDCWIIIYDRVYDLTDFLYKHPGGDDILLEYAGRDGTLAFRSVGHSQLAEAALDPYLIGVLQDKDRLWIDHWGLRRSSR